MGAKTIQSAADFDQLISESSIMGKYELLEKLGEGSFGIVYKCRNISSGKFFAVKFLKLWSVPDIAKSNLIERFQLEFETGRIDSKYLVQSYEINYLLNIPYFISDFCPGGNLERKINAGLSVDKALLYATSILHGLNDLHKNGKIHRDLKPENILFDAQGIPKLTDFGISGHINIQLTKVNNDDEPGQVFGSYAYMAPEQSTNVIRKNTLLPTVDIYSFGVLTYEMLTGHLPFGQWKSTYDIPQYLHNSRIGHITPIHAYNKQVPAEWTRTIYKCLKANREERFQNITEILNTFYTEGNKMEAPVSTTLLKLKVLDGEEPGYMYCVKMSGITTIGRESSNKNTIEIREHLSAYISRQHATLECIKGQIYLRDGQWDPELRRWKKSKNGTFLNGRAVNDSFQPILHYNDILTIGNTTLKVIN